MRANLVFWIIIHHWFLERQCTIFMSVFPFLMYPNFISISKHFSTLSYTPHLNSQGDFLECRKFIQSSVTNMSSSPNPLLTAVYKHYFLLVNYEFFCSHYFLIVNYKFFSSIPSTLPYSMNFITQHSKICKSLYTL